ncbi:MAG: 50S ribosomal protein L19e [Candidatus Bathyarchaeota archaeon]|nr:50S ribosomal protein L19e [Candidatus Bathyarchaeota archaeon]
MNLTNQRRLAASLLEVGVNRVWINPEKIEDVEGAITRGEIRKLIREGTIKALPENGTSRGRARILAQKKRTGRRIGMGTKKGKKHSEVSGKTVWMNRIRALRRKLTELRDQRVITVGTYRNLYMKAKGGEFRSLAELDRHINEQKLRRRTFG